MAFYDNFHNETRKSKSSLGDLITKKQNEFYLGEIKRYVDNPSSFSLLEIGPGKGEFSEVAANSSEVSYYGVEANQTMADNLAKEGYNVSQGMAPPLEDKNQYDVIFMDQVFEHMENRKQAIEMVNSCYNHLANNGLLVICSPEIRLWGVDFFGGDYTHNWPTSLENTKQILTDYDFKVQNSTYITLNIRGQIFNTFIAYATKLFYSLGILSLTGKAFKIKTTLLPSFVVITQKTQ